MYSRGIVAERDPQRHRVRVRFPDRGDLLSPWLQVIVQPQQHGLPREGAQVACLLDEHSESGCVLGVVYSDSDPAPGESGRRVGWVFPGGRVEYDRQANTLTVIAPGGVLLDGNVQVVGGAAPLARADRVDERLDALEEWAMQHVHGTGVGPSTTSLQPLQPGESTAADSITSD